MSGREAGPEVMRCATIYDIAGKLEIARLLDLAFRKLKALGTNEPHRPYDTVCCGYCLQVCEAKYKIVSGNVIC